VKSPDTSRQSVPGPDEIFGEGITLFSSSAVLVEKTGLSSRPGCDYFVLKIALCL